MKSFLLIAIVTGICLLGAAKLTQSDGLLMIGMALLFMTLRTEG